MGVMEPMVKYCSPWVKLMFSAYMGFTMLALMNILSGFFMESAMQVAEDEQKKVVIEQIAHVFETFDKDKSGTITSEEFHALMDNDDSLPFFLKSLDIRSEQAEQLFKLIDRDDSGEINLVEFVEGCERLQGSSKAIDFAAFLGEWQVMVGKVDEVLELLAANGSPGRTQTEI